MVRGFELYSFQPDQVVALRKLHPCGGTRWKILRVGADVTSRCETCGHLMTMKRRDFEKAVRSIIEPRGES